MKKKLLLLILLLVGFAGFVGVRFFILNNQNAFGRIKVLSTPPSTVFIDNQALGHTPYEEKFKTGDFVLKLIPDGTATDTASWQGKIKIYKNALTYVNQELGSSDVTTAGEIFTTTRMETSPKNNNVGEVYVESDPSGAIVYLDNDEKGVAPLILADVNKGDHELSVYMAGFLRRTQKINVDAGYRVNALFKLSLDQSQKKPTPPPEKKEASGSASTTTQKTMVIIKDTPLGYLRVRSEPTTSASEAAQVKPGEKYELVDEKPDWYKIKLPNLSGWVSASYAQKQNP
jgi:hypothetical protein